MKKVVFIIPPEKFRDEELLHPMEQMRKANVRADVASTELKSIHGMRGAEIKSTLKILDINPDNYDAVIVVGGQGTQMHLWNNKPLQELLIRAYQKGKLIAGICAGSVVVAHTKLLDKKKATTFQSDEFIKELKKSGALYTGKDLEISDTIITASGPEAADKFGKAIVNALKTGKESKKFQTEHVHESVSIPFTTPFDDV